MKRRLTLFLAVLFIIGLMSSLAYATEKTKGVKPADRKPVTISEEEALQAELLDAVDNTRKKSTDHSGGKKNVAEVAKVQMLDKRPDK